MKNKKVFTESEYKTMTDFFDKISKEYSLPLTNKWLISYFMDKMDGLGIQIHHSHPDETLAILNPITRKWARENFVYEEPKYIWKNKLKDKTGDNIYLFNTYGGNPLLSFAYYDDAFEEDLDPYPFTEREIKKWGYNPDCFEKIKPEYFKGLDNEE